MAPISTFLALALSFSASIASPLVDRAANPTVKIADGTIVGTATRVSNQPAVTKPVNAYLGVPFADSPPLRFAPPSAPKPWSSPLKAQTLPPACLQQISSQKTNDYFNNPGLPPPPESEDCLFLNVFAPQDACETNLKPVMFWIYGGNLQFGTASLEYYNGSSLAVNEDVVVVAINYRTNMFGFSNSPELPITQQNAGFLDQRFALEWVQKNIKAFGGDPTKVTIFGESAGAYSVKQLLAHPPSPLTFQAAILESQGLGIPAIGSASYQQVALHFGCTDLTSQLECLRKIDGKDIQAYITKNSVGFPPTDDGVTHSKSVLTSIASGAFANVPVFLGTNKNEASVFLNAAGLDGTDLVGDVFALTGANISSFKDTLLGQYAAHGVSITDGIVSRVATDIAFTCTTQILASAIQAAGRQPVWRYQFAGVFPDVSLFPNAGAYHSVEIPEVWGTYPLSSAFGKVTPTQIALSKYMQGAWSQFAKSPAGGPGWPKLGSNHGVELGLLGGDKNPNGEETIPLIDIDFPCVLLDPLEIAAGED